MTGSLVYPGAWPVRNTRRLSVLGALLAGYLLLLPYQFEIVKSLNFAPADCFLVLVLVLAAGCLRYRAQAWTIWHLALILIFVTGSLVSSMRMGALTRYEFLNKDLGLLLPFLSYAAITTAVECWDDLRRFLRIFVFGIVIENVLAVAAYLSAYFLGIQTPFARYGGLRLSGMLLDPNAYGGLLVSAYVVLEAASSGPAPLFRGKSFWFSRLTLLLGILFTFSRSAWMGLTFAMILLLAIRPRVAVRALLPVIVGAPCLVLALGTRFVGIFELMASRPHQIDQRVYLIDAALGAFRRHPFLGGGLGSFRLSMGEVAHNSAMWFLADFGVVGLLVFLAFAGWFFAAGWKAYRNAPASEKPLALALLAAHAAMFGLAMGIEAFYQRQWWVVFGLIGAAYCLTQRTAARARIETEVSQDVET